MISEDRARTDDEIKEDVRLRGPTRKNSDPIGQPLDPSQVSTVDAGDALEFGNTQVGKWSFLCLVTANFR